MSVNKKTCTYTEILFTSMIDDLNNSPDIVSETLKENNIDENVVAQKANELAGRLISKMKMKAAKECKKNILQKALALLSNADISIASLNPKEKLFQLLSASRQSPSFTFNSLQNFSNQDVLDMLSEIEIIEIIEELEKQEK